MEVCRQATFWGQAAAPAREEDEQEDDDDESSSSIHDKQGGFDPIFSTKQQTSKDLVNIAPAACGKDVRDNDAQADDEDDVVVQQKQELDMQLAMECNMCGYAGLPQYLFKCLSCSRRFQHTYCSMLYPSKMKVALCNWCLPMMKVENNIAAGENVLYNCERQPSQRVQQIKKHSKAFEYLLQITADLADDTNHSRSGCFKDAAHDQIVNISTSHEVGFDDDTSRKGENPGLQPLNISMIKANPIEGESASSRMPEAAKNLSSTTKSLKRSRSYIDDLWRSEKVRDWVDYDQVIKKFSSDYKKVHDHKVGCQPTDHLLLMQRKCLNDDEDDDNEKADAMASVDAQKYVRPRSIIWKKQSMGAAAELGGVDCTSSSKAGGSCSLIMEAAGPAEMGNLNDHDAAAAAASGDDDDQNSAALHNVKQMSAPKVVVGSPSTTTTWVAATSPAKALGVAVTTAGGKRAEHHLANSPASASAASNRAAALNNRIRYKLLADVLC